MGPLSREEQGTDADTTVTFSSFNIKRLIPISTPS